MQPLDPMLGNRHYRHTLNCLGGREHQPRGRRTCRIGADDLNRAPLPPPTPQSPWPPPPPLPKSPCAHMREGFRNTSLEPRTVPSRCSRHVSAGRTHPQPPGSHGSQPKPKSPQTQFLCTERTLVHPKPLAATDSMHSGRSAP